MTVWDARAVFHVYKTLLNDKTTFFSDLFIIIMIMIIIIIIITIIIFIGH